jgi:hypothetical protein
MLDSVAFVEKCSSSLSSDSSSSEPVRASPPPIPDLFISMELGDIAEMLVVETTQETLHVEAEAHAVSPAGEFSCFCMFHMFCSAFVSYVHLDVGYASARGDDDDDADAGLWQMVQG